MRDADILELISQAVEKNDLPVLYRTLEDFGIPRVRVKKLVRKGKLVEVLFAVRSGYRIGVATWEWAKRHRNHLGGVRYVPQSSSPEGRQDH